MDVFWWSVERAGGDTGMGDLVKKMEGASKPEEPELVVYRDSTASEAKTQRRGDRDRNPQPCAKWDVT